MSQSAKERATPSSELSCPSTTARDPDARVFGVVLGGAETPEIAYLPQPVPLSSIDAPLPPDVQPTEIYRLAGQCVKSSCQHYSGTHCRLGEHVATTLDAVTRALPPCSIRHECRWFHEQRAQACLRCPQVVTEVQVPLGQRTSPKGEGKRQLPVV
jgi:hypothetical protein